jgi:hypothetical protein
LAILLGPAGLRFFSYFEEEHLNFLMI